MVTLTVDVPARTVTLNVDTYVIPPRTRYIDFTSSGPGYKIKVDLDLGEDAMDDALVSGVLDSLKSTLDASNGGAHARQRAEPIVAELIARLRKWGDSDDWIRRILTQR